MKQKTALDQQVQFSFFVFNAYLLPLFLLFRFASYVHAERFKRLFIDVG